MKYLLACLSLLFLTACPDGPVGNPRVPEPAQPVELSRYIGKWYEIGRYDHSFERGCEAVTAEYTQREDGLVGVLNQCRKPDGSIDSADGKAKIVRNSDNAKLKVSFFGPFYVGDYWVLDHAEDYSWSIVGEPSGRYLWILARDANLSAKAKDKLWERARGLGYNTSMLIEVKH